MPPASLSSLRAIAGVVRAATALALAAGAASAAAQDVDTRVGAFGAGFWSTGYYQDGNGNGNGYSVGQTFRAPVAAPVLHGFSLWLNNHFGSASLHTTDFRFRAYLYELNPATSRLVGPALFESTTQPNAPSDAPHEYAFGVGGLELDPSRLYVAFVSSARLPNPNPGNYTLGAVALVSGSPYAAGELVVQYGDAAALTTSPWSRQTGSDAAFTADFGPVTATPEPGTWALLGAGLLALGGAAARRGRRGA